LEIGCAPGKLLAWVAHAFHAKVTGIDYSDVGLSHARKLFRALAISGDLRQENVFDSTLADSTFDLIYSIGVIEHFDDPRDIVKCHIRFAVPGGRVLIVLPNYGGLYRRLQYHFDPENLLIHNLNIMNTDALRALVPAGMCKDIRAYHFGRMSPWIVSFHRRWPRSLAIIASLIANGLGLVQPIEIAALSPFLVLEATRNS